MIVLRRMLLQKYQDSTLSAASVAHETDVIFWANEGPYKNLISMEAGCQGIDPDPKFT